MPQAKGQLSWTNPTKNTDGTDYNAATENAGYDVALDSTTPDLSLPFALGTSFDMSTTDQWKALKSGSHTIRLRVVTKGGTTSDWASATFQIVGTPLAPTAVALA